MMPLITQTMNSISRQGPLSGDLESKLTRFGARDRVIFYDVPPIDPDRLFEFCRNFDVFGKDPGQNRSFIQLYVVKSFMEKMSEEVGPNNVSVEPIIFEKERRDGGRIKFVPANRGFSLNVQRQENKDKLENLCTFEGAYEINLGLVREFVTSYVGSMRNWNLAFTGSISKKISHRAGWESRPYENLNDVELLKGDRFLMMQNMAKSIMPSDKYSLLFAYSRRQFEAQFVRDSPIAYMLGKHGHMSMLLHNLDWSMMEGISKDLQKRYKDSNVETNKEVPSHLWPVRQFISKKGDLSDLLMPLLDNFESQLHEYVQMYNPTGAKHKDLDKHRVPGHLNKYAYIKIMKGIPLNFKEQIGTESFLYLRFLKPVKSILRVIEQNVKDDPWNAKQLIFRLPPFSYSSMKQVMDLNIFPHNFPHIYLESMSQHLEKFKGSTLKEIETYVHGFNEDIETPAFKKDIYYRERRYAGSFESGGKRAE